MEQRIDLFEPVYETADEAMKRKHEELIQRHETQFGKLGHFMTEDQKARLRKSLEEKK